MKKLIPIAFAALLFSATFVSQASAQYVYYAYPNQVYYSGPVTTSYYSTSVPYTTYYPYTTSYSYPYTTYYSYPYTSYYTGGYYAYPQSTTMYSSPVYTGPSNYYGYTYSRWPWSRRTYYY